MTIIGTRIEHTRALLWSDTQHFYRDLETDQVTRPLGHSLKLAVNEKTHVAAVGAGDHGGNR